MHRTFAICLLTAICFNVVADEATRHITRILDYAGDTGDTERGTIVAGMYAVWLRNDADRFQLLQNCLRSDRWKTITSAAAKNVENLGFTYDYGNDDDLMLMIVEDVLWNINLENLGQRRKFCVQAAELFPEHDVLSVVSEMLEEIVTSAKKRRSLLRQTKNYLKDANMRLVQWERRNKPKDRHDALRLQQMQTYEKQAVKNEHAAIIKDLKLGESYEAQAAEIAPAEAQLKACADSILAALFPNSPRDETETDTGFEHD